ncbi:hypothetical protein CVIRNUC_007600 [Coccomyxa viridis]|uniref:Maternal effect embryo arrest 18 n=1 Tax=Coccomyxa viridis TaxID=1274662 RepID=A0AAV1IAJ7_9CHLO|nr:hypothetical protein CVIRNUC_007600 [Coccomyxa viridis]
MKLPQCVDSNSPWAHPGIRKTCTCALSAPFDSIRPRERWPSRPTRHRTTQTGCCASQEPPTFDMENGAFAHAMRSSTQSEVAALAHQASLKGSEGPALVVFSGGTAFNSVAGHLRQLTTRVTHILPVSDDGGSTAEIVRVLGGPAVGDIRSRCLRLADDADAEARAVRKLLAHRLSGESAERAKAEWYEVVEGDHSLWDGVSEPYKHTIRAFLVYFHTQIQRHSTERFNFRNGSVGNFFFAGARLFFRSLEAAIFLFSRVARIPEGSLVLPAICTEERITLGAEMANGTVIRGQNEISHPSAPESPGPIRVEKHGRGPPLAAPVRRIFYLSAEGTMREHEVFPPPNPRLLAQVDCADAIVYGMGSLYTSICPSLVLKGVGEKIAERQIPKIFLLNGSHDRETSASKSTAGPMTACDVVLALCDALNRRHAKAGQPLDNPPDAYITALLVPKGGAIAIDTASLEAIGIREIVEVPSMLDKSGNCLFEPLELVKAIERLVQYQPFTVS